MFLNLSLNKPSQGLAFATYVWYLLRVVASTRGQIAVLLRSQVPARYQAQALHRSSVLARYRTPIAHLRVTGMKAPY